MVIRKRHPELELSDAEFERLLDLLDVLDEVQLLRLQCKVGVLLGNSEPGPPPVAEGASARARSGSGTYARTDPGDAELDFSWDDETDPGV